MKLATLTSAATIALGATFSAACANESPNAYTDESAAVEETTAIETAAVEAGQSVYDAGGTQVGTVESVTTDASGAEIAVVSVGSYLGMGEKSIAVPTSQLSENVDGSGLTVSMTAEAIEAAPEHQAETPMDEPPVEEPQ